MLGGLGHDVVVVGERISALGREDLDQFDLIISDLTEDAEFADTLDALGNPNAVTLVQIKSSTNSAEFAGKWLDLLKQAVPTLSRPAAIMDPSSDPVGAANWESVRRGAQTLGCTAPTQSRA